VETLKRCNPMTGSALNVKRITLRGVMPAFRVHLENLEEDPEVAAAAEAEAEVAAAEVASKPRVEIGSVRNAADIILLVGRSVTTVALLNTE